MAEPTIAELQRQIRVLTRRNEALEIRNALLLPVVSAGVMPGAIDDALNRSERGFKVTDGEIRGINGERPEEWVSNLKIVAPHLFGETAQSEQKPKEAVSIPREFQGRDNPWSPTGWNLTRQGEVFTQFGEDAAQQLAKAAGVDVNAMKPATQSGK